VLRGIRLVLNGLKWQHLLSFLPLPPCGKHTDLTMSPAHCPSNYLRAGPMHLLFPPCGPHRPTDLHMVTYCSSLWSAQMSPLDQANLKYLSPPPPTPPLLLPHSASFISLFLIQWFVFLFYCLLYKKIRRRARNLLCSWRRSKSICLMSKSTSTW
jgi:hypothetical protein